MTTAVQYEGVESVVARLDRVRWRHRCVQIALGLAVLIVVGCGSLVLLGAVCGYWPGQPPTALRWTLLVAALACWSAAAGWFAVLLISRRLNHAQAARLAELAHKSLKNGLINALQLSHDPDQSPQLVQCAIVETMLKAEKLDLASSVATRPMRKWLALAAAAAVVLTAFGLFQGPRLSRGLAAVFNPGGFVPAVNSVKLVSIEPGDATCFAGQAVTITAVIDADDRRLDGRVLIAQPAATRAMLAAPPAATPASSDRRTFSCALGPAEQTFEYSVQIGDSRFPADRPYYRVTVLQKITVEGLDLLYTYPPYLGAAEKPVVNAAGPIEAPLGSSVKATLRLSSPVPDARLELRSGPRVPMVVDAAGKAFAAVLTVSADDAYRIVLTDASGRALQQLPDPAGATGADGSDGFYRITAVPDDPPKLSFVEPNRDMAVAPAGKLPIVLRVSDDHGLAEVKFFLGREKQPLPEVTGLPGFDQAAGKTQVELKWPVQVGNEYREGDVLEYYASATDRRKLGNLGGPQTTESPHFKIIVQDAAKVAAERAKKYEQLRAKLMALLEKQQSQRVNTGVAATRLTDLVQVRDAGKQLVAGQQQIKADALDVVDHFPFEPEMLTVQQALAVLAANDGAAAIAQAGVLQSLGAMDARADACQTLTATQDRIIAALQNLLAILPSIAKGEQSRKDSTGEDLPPEVKEKLANLKAELEKFIDQQKKIIQASDSLTKRPMDNLSKEDEKLLKDLAAAQDKWEKFLTEQFSDFSKMAQQDFSNPAMLKELISIKTDVTMAKDALSKKAVEIATALEDNGIENAKTLTANIEKWLPDTPDRIKWDMEDPTAQSMTEQPEMPKELEDLVGDLLEQEEDLFDQMEDVTAKYGQSGDKGIGWDAMDGPISNMNAQGVTGNQLPNSSEISGRSGEGRQGKSLGEYVEDKAVGKGGRRTPTRLTPEPFQQGQVSDTSEEPAGGATGGGKLSGSGSEGMEGPLPPQVDQEMKRMAGKHAQLLNKAERMQGGMKVSDYSNFQLLQAITLMNKVQTDLDHGRYVNALRQKNVTLDALKQTQQLLGGKIDVTADATANMPKYVQDDINDSSKAKLPAEYQDVLKRYFSRLADGGATPTTGPGK